MSIRPEWRHFYGAEWRKIIRPRILARAGYKCEDCGKPHGVQVDTLPGGLWFDVDAHVWRAPDGPLELNVRYISKKTVKKIRVKIGVAHLNHQSGDDRDENLRALCGYCHFRHDRSQHKRTREERKDARRPLFVLLKSG